MGRDHLNTYDHQGEGECGGGGGGHKASKSGLTLISTYNSFGLLDTFPVSNLRQGPP